MAPASPHSFGAQLKAHRKALGLTQKALGARAGCTVIALQKLEAGARRPSSELAQALANSLELGGDARERFLANAPLESRDERSALPLAALPEWPTAWVPRDDELRRLTRLLSGKTVRTLTLHGPAGAGKTRLAVQLARLLSSDFRDGVCFVALAGLTAPEQVGDAVASALGIADRPDRSRWDAVCALLRGRQMLLLLDNFEHILAAAPLVAELLANCPRVKVLVTSRHVLRLSGEHLFAINLLDAASARELFLSRARLQVPGYAPDDDELARIDALCARLDGLPLAIELAAARLTLLPVGMMLTQLDVDEPERALALLDDGAVDAPERQRSLARAIDWSYRLLDAEAQRCFGALSVCAGGFDIEAASVLCRVSADAGLRIARALHSHSLLRADASGRYDMLESLRTFAVWRLQQSGEEAAVRRTHAEYFEALAVRVRPMVSKGSESTRGLSIVRAERENFAAAQRWMRENGEGVLLARCSASLWQAMWLLGRWREARAWLDAALAMLDPAAPDQRRPYGRARSAAGALAAALMDLPAAQAHFEAALALYRAAQDMNGVSVVLGNLSLVYLGRGDLDAAQSLLDECLAMDRASGDGQYVAIDLDRLGVLALARGDARAAERHALEALALFQERGSADGIASANVLLGRARDRLDDSAGALACFERAVALAEQHGMRQLRALASSHLACLLAEQGQPERAAVLLESALRELHDVGALAELSDAFASAGARAIEHGQLADGARLLGAMRRTHQTCGLAPGVLERQRYEAACASARGEIGEVMLERLMLEGATLTVDDLVALCKRVLFERRL